MTTMPSSEAPATIKRRQKNKEAAARHRERKAQLIEKLTKENDELKKELSKLKNLYNNVSRNKDLLYEYAANHECFLSTNAFNNSTFFTMKGATTVLYHSSLNKAVVRQPVSNCNNGVLHNNMVCFPQFLVDPTKTRPIPGNYQQIPYATNFQNHNQSGRHEVAQPAYTDSCEIPSIPAATHQNDFVHNGPIVQPTYTGPYQVPPTTASTHQNYSACNGPPNYAVQPMLSRPSSVSYASTGISCSYPSTNGPPSTSVAQPSFQQIGGDYGLQKMKNSLDQIDHIDQGFVDDNNFDFASSY